MNSRGKGFFILLIGFLVVTSIIIVKPTLAQSIPKPSVPEFTLALVSHPYDVAPTTTIDPYTGKSIITQSGYHVENQSIDITIKNQPFTLFSVNGSEVDFWYQVQFKGHYSTDWQIYYIPLPNSIESTTNIPQSNGDYTIISVPTNNDQVNSGSMTDFTQGGQVDIQVKALVGSFILIPHGLVYYDYTEFVGEESEWSNTQTITITDNYASTTANPTTPYLPTLAPFINSNGSTQITIQISSTNLLLLVGIISVVVLAMVLIIVLSIRHRKAINFSK